MHESVHRSPWPTVEEFAAIAAPAHEGCYPALVGVIEAVRKAKADANKSMKAPVQRVTVTGAPATLAALDPALDDLNGMLHIETADLVEGMPETGLVDVEIEME